MLSKEEMKKYVNDGLTISEVSKKYSYTRSQIVYACKKYNLKLLSKRRRFHVEESKVKVLLDNGFKTPEIAKILNVNSRCIYNLMYRKKWTKQRVYPKLRKEKNNCVFGIKIELNQNARLILKSGKIINTTIKDLINNEEVKFIIIS